MSSQYLAAGEYATYGLPGPTNANSIIQASALLDAYLFRPEGLIWTPDAAGMPCFMAALSPMFQLQLGAGITPGTNVQVPLTGPVSQLQPGDVLILDKANQNAVEAVVIGAVNVGNQPNVVQLQQVLFSHNSAVSADYGLVIEEQRYVPQSRPITLMARRPLMRLHSGVGRYGYGRRGDAANYNMEQFNLLAALSKFGGPPAWEVFSVLNTGFDVQTGQVWIPAGIMLAYYSEVKLRYVAGFSAANVPPAIKQACASLVKAMQARPTLGDIRSYKAGDTQIVNFTSSALDDDVRRALDPWVANTFA